MGVEVDGLLDVQTMAALKSDRPGGFLQIKVTLRGVMPQVWRRLVIPASLGLPAFHLVLQGAFGWDNCHLHAFQQGRRSYQPFHPDFDLGRDRVGLADEADVSVGDLLKAEGDTLDYQYDMGDFWEHDILVEEVVTRAPTVRLRCLAGACAAPPEDCGGAGMYKELLDALADPEHPDHEHLMEWTGGPIDPETFDLAAINRALRKIKA
jgi:hypothetical protein